MYFCWKLIIRPKFNTCKIINFVLIRNKLLDKKVNYL